MLDPDLYQRALDFAARAHGTQTVLGSGFPYVVHVTKVAAEVHLGCLHAGLDENLAVPVALLHDTMEDCGVSHEALALAFGPRVADAVQALTKDEAVPKERRMAECLARIRAQPKEVWAVKLADRITNLEPPPPQWTAEKRRGYLAEARDILSALAGACALLEARFQQRLEQYQQHLGVE